MTDPRPRPQYGEYAPLPSAAPEKPADDSAETPPSPDTGAHTPELAPPSAAEPGFANTASAAVKPERKRRMWDVLLTSTLLFFGVVDVISTFGTVSDLGPALREGLEAQGAGTFSSDAIAADAGAVANIVRVVVLLITIVFALLQIQRRRIAFWIPLVGATIAGITLVVAVFIAVLSDPGFIAYVENMQPQ